jgi:tetratricopeptide (TPR) repeat protein
MDWEADQTLADYLWQLSLEEGPDSLDRVKQALTWYGKSMRLNRFNAYAPVGCGLCLDRLGQWPEATRYFKLAHRVDPHNCYIALEVGRHCIEIGDLAAAKEWIVQGALRVAATDVAIAEAEKLERFMADPLHKAAASDLQTNKTLQLDPEMAHPDFTDP